MASYLGPFGEEEEIARAYGYILRSHKHEMYGICPDCQKKTGTRSPH